jgi:hypothetical protein
MQLKSQISPEFFQRRYYCKNWRTLPHCTTLLSLLLHLLMYHLKSVQKQGCDVGKFIFARTKGGVTYFSTANPTHTAPADPLSIVAHIPSLYPPPPGLPPLPVTDHPNALLDVPLSAPTVPVAPTRRSPRVHVVRTPSSFGYSAVTVPAPYIDIVHGDNETISAANLTAGC